MLNVANNYLPLETKYICIEGVEFPDIQEINNDSIIEESEDESLPTEFKTKTKQISSVKKKKSKVLNPNS